MSRKDILGEADILPFPLMTLPTLSQFLCPTLLRASHTKMLVCVRACLWHKHSEGVALRVPKEVCTGTTTSWFPHRLSERPAVCRERCRPQPGRLLRHPCTGSGVEAQAHYPARRWEPASGWHSSSQPCSPRSRRDKHRGPRRLTRPGAPAAPDPGCPGRPG